MSKRVVDWPPRSADKKPCRDSATSSLPELSSLLSALPPHLVAKRHHPPAHDDHDLKRPRYDTDALDAVMQGLTISCAEDSGIEEENGSRPCWSSFLPELLHLICCRLPLADVPRFGAVCRDWNACAFPVYPADASPVLISTTVTESGLIRCYSPYFNKMFVLSTPIKAPESRIFSAAANGWVMLRTPKKTILLVNLLDGSVSETPARERDEGFMCVDHADGHPKDSEIFDIYANNGTVRIQSWYGEQWESIEEEGNGDDSDDENDVMLDDDPRVQPFTMSFCSNPVLHNGLLYCLGQEGSLGVYDHADFRWRVLRKPAGFGSEFPYKNCHLIESQGELLAALIGKNGTPIYVLRLDETRMAWERMESLDGRALFTGTTASMSMAKLAETMANKVFLPRFYGRPQVVQAELTNSGGRLFFVAKPNQESDAKCRDGAWCYDLDSGVDKQFTGSKNLLQYVWVNFCVSSPPDDDDDGSGMDDDGENDGGGEMDDDGENDGGGGMDDDADDDAGMDIGT